MPVASLSPMLLLAWPFSVVVLLSSSLACGSSPPATLLARPVRQLPLFYDYSSASYCCRIAFSSYGAFWLSFATLLIPGSGIGDAYAASDDPGKIVDAIAIYLTAWMIVTFLFLFVHLFFHLRRNFTHHLSPVVCSLASLRKSMGLTALFFFLTVTFLLLAVGKCGLFCSPWTLLTVSAR